MKKKNTYTLQMKRPEFATGKLKVLLHGQIGHFERKRMVTRKLFQGFEIFC